MNTQNWLTLMEYSSQYRVSMSTLRRRIKAGEIEFKFIEGKYLLKNGPLQLKSAGGPEPIAPPPKVSAQVNSAASAASATPLSTPVTTIPAASADAAGSMRSETFWQTTQNLLAEIKKAFGLVLEEKQTQIIQLKEELADLKTLVRALEDENERLKKASTARSMLSADFDLGLEA